MTIKSCFLLISVVVAHAEFQHGSSPYYVTGRPAPVPYPSSPLYRNAVATKELPADADIRYQSDHLFSKHGNLGQVARYTDNIDTPFTSVRKSDFRVTSSPGYRGHSDPIPNRVSPYDAPQIVAPNYTPHIKYAAGPAHPTQNPYVASEPKRISRESLLGVAYSSAPAVSHMSFDGYGIKYAY